MVAVVGDSNWGKMQLNVLEEGRSGVYDFGDSTARTITITENRYGTGQETATPQLRGSDDTPFLQDDVGPAWETYSVPISKTWRYIQFREIKES